MLLPLLGEFRDRVRAKVEARHAPGRIKQWLHLLARHYAGARALFAEIRPLRALAEVDGVLARHGVPLGRQPVDAAPGHALAAAALPCAEPAVGCAA